MNESAHFCARSVLPHHMDFFSKRIAIFLVIAIVGGLSFGWRVHFFGIAEPLNYVAGIPEAHAAISLVQTTNAVSGGNGGNTVTATFGATPTSGNLLVAVGGAPASTTLALTVA